LALLCDITHHLNDLNAKLQGQKIHVPYMSGAITPIETKMKQLWKQL